MVMRKPSGNEIDLRGSGRLGFEIEENARLLVFSGGQKRPEGNRISLSSRPQAHHFDFH
jgi:hypothetical protein